MLHADEADGRAPGRWTVDRLGHAVETWALLRGARALRVPALLPADPPTGRDLHGRERPPTAAAGRRVALPDTVCQVVLARLHDPAARTPAHPDGAAPVVVTAQGVAFRRTGPRGSLTAAVLREIVVLGTDADVAAVSDTYTALAAEFAACCGLPVQRAPRTAARVRVTVGPHVLVTAGPHDRSEPGAPRAAGRRSGCVAIDLTVLHHLLRERSAGDDAAVVRAVERACGEAGRR